jgi:hypothetical protein
MFRNWFKRGIVLAMVPLSSFGCYGGHHREHSVAEVQERARDGADWLLDWVDATDEQRRSFNTIVDRSVPELLAFRTERKATVQSFAQALKQPTVDAAELEGIRQRALSLADRASLRATQAITELAGVLNATQRQKIADRILRHAGPTSSGG